jgi:LPPG:FO 2-phospho-L-lactate transferase
MLAQMGHDVSALGVARMYQDICGTMVIDPVDSAQRPAIEALAMKVVVQPTVMRNLEDKKRLALTIIQLAAKRKTGAAA